MRKGNVLQVSIHGNLKYHQEQHSFYHRWVMVSLGVFKQAKLLLTWKIHLVFDVKTSLLASVQKLKS